MEKRKSLKSKIKERWFFSSLKQKIGMLAAMVTLIVAISIIFNVVILDFALHGFNSILEYDSLCNDYREAMEEEAEAFRSYARDSNEENLKQYEIASIRTKRSVSSLPFQYSDIGKERYAATWSILNGYENYVKKRDEVILLSSPDPQVIPRGYVTELYKVYSMQNYMIEYGKRLVQSSLKEGTAKYHTMVPFLSSFPYIIFLLAVFSLGGTFYLVRTLNHDVIVPVVLLANVSRKIAVNDFSGDDIEVDSQDEIGELVLAFNKMKHSTEKLITALEEKNYMAELFHKEVLEKLDVEKRLDSTKMELLKSQINPHFLFNTLNMISCMAKLEDADTTQRMIDCLGNLFRYNLKTPESEVLLEKELAVVNDYMYLQQMRFGRRLKYRIDCAVDSGRYMIPTFALQPLVENAVIHGLAKKENGGSICIRIREEGERLVLSVADTGVGMTEAALKELRSALADHCSTKVGIGVGNIYQRIEKMYENGAFEIYSRKNCGTAVRLFIPKL